MFDHNFSFPLRMRNVSDKNCRGNQNTFYFVFNNFFFFFENRNSYEIMWKHFVEPDKQQMTVWHMLFACWTPKATNTHTHTHIYIYTYTHKPLLGFYSNNGRTNERIFCLSCWTLEQVALTVITNLEGLKYFIFIIHDWCVKYNI